MPQPPWFFFRLFWRVRQFTDGRGREEGESGPPPQEKKTCLARRGWSVSRCHKYTMEKEELYVQATNSDASPFDPKKGTFSKA